MLGSLDEELGKQRFLELAKKCGEIHNYQRCNKCKDVEEWKARWMKPNCPSPKKCDWVE